MIEKSPLRYERLDEWIYPGELTLDEYRELAMRENYGAVIGEALAILARRDDPTAKLLQEFWDAFSSLAWVGRYMIESQQYGTQWRVRVESIGNISVAHVYDLRAWTMLQANRSLIVRDWFDRMFRDYVRGQFALPAPAAPKETTE